MANEFLVSKWKLWFKALDVNHDGVLSIADIQECRRTFADLNHLDGERKSEVQKNLDTWWNDYIIRGQTGEITESEFVAACNKEFTADKKKFHSRMAKCFDMVFDVIDTNKDRSISEEEYHIVLKAYGHVNDVLDTKFFEAYNPVDGLVPLRDFVESWVDFATSEDASKESVVKTAFEGGV